MQAEHPAPHNPAIPELVAGEVPQEDLPHVWRALANETRRRLLDHLRAGPVPTGELSERFPALSRFAVMQHLRVLEEGGLVIRQKVGRRTINHLNPVPIQQIHRRWVARFQQPWAEVLVSLKHTLENPEAEDR